MEVKIDTNLNNNYNIISSLKKYNDYYVYSALDNQNGNVVIITERFHEKAIRTDDGEIIIPDDLVDEFKITTSNLLNDIYNIMSLEINTYLKIITTIEQNNTAYIVSEEIKGLTIQEFLAKKGSPFVFNEINPIFLDFLDAVSTASSDFNVYFDINPSTLYITNDAKLRLDCFYVNNYDESNAIKNIAGLYYYMLAMSEPSENKYINGSENFSESDKLFVDTIVSEYNNPSSQSIKEFYTKIYNIYNNKQAPETKEDKKDKKNIDWKPHLIMSSAVAVIIIIFTLSSFIISKIIIGNPLSTKQDEIVDNNDKNSTKGLSIEFDYK